ncbi:MAG: hypothetical protein M0042_08950 [Nitrospiraceae bacterium]|nr:hypothetical protein [Nitrospiraceae bacterium]
MKGIVDQEAMRAAIYFREEVLEIMPDIPRQELSEMVGEYLFYHNANVGKELAHEVVEETCGKKAA